MLSQATDSLALINVRNPEEDTGLALSPLPASCQLFKIKFQAAQRGCGASILRDIQNPAGHGPVKPDPGSSYSSHATVGNVQCYCFNNKRSSI